MAKSLLIVLLVCMKPGQMGDLIEDLRKEKGKILLREHFGLSLKVFVAGFMLAAVFAIPVMFSAFRAEIRALQAQVTTANDRRQKWEEESKRQAQVAEHYRDRFFAVTKTNGSFTAFSHDDLQDYALRMVRALWIVIREQETIINKLEADFGSGLLTRTNVEDLKKTFEERSNAEWHAGQKCMAEYNIRLKADVLMLKREILSRIPAGNDIDQNGLPTDYWYESPWNFYGFKKMVADLDRIAKLLPVSKEHLKKSSS